MGGSDDQGFRAVILKLTKVRLAGRFRVFCELELGSPKHVLVRFSNGALEKKNLGGGLKEHEPHF